MSARRLPALAAALALAVLAARDIVPSGASFTTTRANPENSFTAAAVFPGMRLATGSYTGNGAASRGITGVGFAPDAVIVKGLTTLGTTVIRTSTMSGDATKPLTGATALSANMIRSLDASGFTVGSSNSTNRNGITYHWIALRSRAEQMSLGSYTGNGVNGRQMTGLGYSPEYVAVLSAGAAQAVQRFTGMARAFNFDADVGGTNRITALGADGFTLGTESSVNANGTAYHYLAFNETPGVIDTGSYTGNATDNRNVAGVGFAPQYVITRPNDTASARRGLHRPASLGGDATLDFGTPNSIANAIQALQADGFQLGTQANVNASGVSYHYLALRDGGAGS